MKARVFIAIVALLAVFALAACGNDSEGEQVAQPVPGPMADAPVPAAEPAGSGSASADSSGMVMAVDGLAADCLPGGGLTDVATVVSCNAEAMQAAGGFSFDGSVNLLAVFPFPVDPPADAQADMQGLENLIAFSGDIDSGQESIRFTVSLGPEGEKIEVTTLLIGNDVFSQDPATKLWFKGAPPDDQLFSIVQMVGMLSSAQDIPTELTETVDLDDGTVGYVLVSEQTGPEGMGDGAMMGVGAGEVTRIVGADDFLTREVRVSATGLGGEAAEVVAINYRGFGEVAAIEAPANFMELPPDAFSSGIQEPATVLGLSRDADGNVAVQFSKPVFVTGEVILYVLEPSTGGWELPLLSGSGTDTLVFDAAAEGNPALVAGEHEIAFIGFGDNAEIADADGVRANDLFDTWTYE